MNKLKVFISSEQKSMFRNRTFFLFGLLFTFLLMTITSIQLFSLPPTASFTRFSASILNVLLFLLPLFTLTIGSLSISTDVESKWFSLMKTYPLNMMSYTTGKLISLFFSFCTMLIIGFGFVILFYSLQRGHHLDWLLFFLSIGTVAIFSSLSILIGCLATNRIHSLSLSLTVWAFFLLIYDYMIMSLGTIVSGNLLKNMVIVLTFTNPAEWLRTGFMIYSGYSSTLGPVYYEFSSFFLSPIGMTVYVIISGLWVVIPIFISNFILKRKES
ncbi:ABC transporter permease [Bacillus carboniphilus]|uniref:ABC transporter permease n=1 Tax=Bacillus carboniphilus TaxID=86663 RepID=A0ABY9JP89_9BACI|nr:ABC transporter permease [Bacillus carboniphilus]WLR41224.1 ABC transporter permease [Bacillus carboniphilus]